MASWGLYNVAFIEPYQVEDLGCPFIELYKVEGLGCLGLGVFGLGGFQVRCFTGRISWDVR